MSLRCREGLLIFITHSVRVAYSANHCFDSTIQKVRRTDNFFGGWEHSYFIIFRIIPWYLSIPIMENTMYKLSMICVCWLIIDQNIINNLCLNASISRILSSMKILDANRPGRTDGFSKKIQKWDVQYFKCKNKIVLYGCEHLLLKYFTLASWRIMTAWPTETGFSAYFVNFSAHSSEKHNSSCVPLLIYTK